MHHQAQIQPALTAHYSVNCGKKIFHPTAEREAAINSAYRGDAHALVRAFIQLWLPHTHSAGNPATAAHKVYSQRSTLNNGGKDSWIGAAGPKAEVCCFLLAILNACLTSTVSSSSNWVLNSHYSLIRKR